MLYRISVTERGLTGIANIFRSRLSRLDDLLGAGTVPLTGSIFIFKFSTLYAYFCTEFSPLAAHFQTEFSTPHPSFKTILGPCVRSCVRAGRS